MMTDFMNQDVGDQLAKRYVTALTPLVEDRAAIQEDHRWQGLAVAHRTIGQIDALVEAGQLERIGNVEGVQYVIRGEVIDADRHIARQAAERVRQGLEGRLGQGSEIIQGRGELRGQGHAVQIVRLRRSASPLRQAYGSRSGHSRSNL